MTRNELRKEIRLRRRALSIDEQKKEGVALKEQLIKLPEVMHAKRVALYLANDGELDPMPFITWCWAHNIAVYLPVIHPFSKGNLLFLAFTENTIMRKNCYGISEPTLDVTTVCPAGKLDIIFTPLVAFDSTGGRLGMGGGFYDRTLSSCKHETGLHVIGIAHDCQQVSSVPLEIWDMPLPKVITPTKLFVFN